MAFGEVLTALVFALALSTTIVPSASQFIEGKLSCSDCTHNYDFSGIKVLVKCEGVKNLAVATTEDKGFFKVELPSEHTKHLSGKCFVKLVSGPNQLYASRKNQVSQVVKGREKNSYTISTPLSFFTSCPQNTHCKASNQFDSSKTFDLPLPPAWGLAPSSYYVPLFPIIGIP